MKKTFRFLMGALLALSLSACERENNTGGGEDGQIKDPAYARFALVIGENGGMQKASKASETDAGTQEEQQVTDVTLIFVDSATEQVAHVETIGKMQLTPGNAQPGADNVIRYNTPVFKVPAGTYMVYAGVNMGELKNKVSVGTSLTDLQESMYTTADGLVDDISEAGKFLMTSFRAAVEADDNRVRLDKSHTMTDPYQMNISVERTVAKIQYNTAKENRELSFAVSDANGTNREVKGKLTAMTIVNRNLKTYVFGDDSRSAEGYPSVDPNFDGNYSGAFSELPKDATDLLLESDGTPNYPHYYCLENTDIADNQQKDKMTAAMFKVQYSPADALWYINNDLSITKDREEGQTFYKYNNLLFANKEAIVAYYKAYGVQDSVQAVTNLLDELETLETAEELSRISEIKRSLQDNYYISAYYHAEGFYLAWIRHNTGGAYDPTDGVLEVMEYGVVRNHWYKLSVNSISNFGVVDPSIDPEDPIEDENSNIEIEILIQPWKVVINDFDL